MSPYAVTRSSPRAHSRPRRDTRPINALLLATFALFVLLVLSAACSPDASAWTPLGPGILLSTATAQQVSEFIPSLSDVQTRLLPTLGDRASATQLGTQLSQIEVTLNRGDSQGTELQIGLARATLAAYPAAARAMDAVELSVIDIVLDRAAQLVGLPALANRIGA